MATKFIATQRCYVEGILLEPDQMMTVGPHTAQRLAKNKNLKLVGKLDPAPKAGAKKEGEEIEVEEETVKVGPAPQEMKLVRPA
jgi:hypothetical protein